MEKKKLNRISSMKDSSSDNKESDKMNLLLKTHNDVSPRSSNFSNNTSSKK